MKKNYVVKQRWDNLFFLNFKVDYCELRKIVPDYLEIDTFEGSSYTSVVPFEMSKIRFSFTPVIPFSSLSELNLRTYVKFNNVPGIYFFTLDSNHKIGNFIANRFFHLPYRYSKISITSELSKYIVDSNGLDLNASIFEAKEKTKKDIFLCERYKLFTDNNRDIFCGTVHHHEWNLQNVLINHYNENLNKKYNIYNYEFDSSFFCSGFDVHFDHFQKVGKV